MTRYKPRWYIGDRVKGLWNNIPFVGSVLIDSEVNPDIGPIVHISVDLPIKYKDRVYTIISSKPEKIESKK